AGSSLQHFAQSAKNCKHWNGVGHGMADIFISYAQKAPEPTQTLAEDLARLKYSIWFDQRLLPMEKFGQAINRELDNAKAVITIWSEPALKSDWVYAE